MNGEDFYQLFKDSLSFVGSSWREKEDVDFYIEDGKLTVRSKSMEMSLKLPKEEIVINV